MFTTSRAGDAQNEGAAQLAGDGAYEARITVHLSRPRQTFFGVGGSLTQASAAALSTLSPAKRQEVLEAYFGPAGAHYTLSRTHIASSDFSTESYQYVPDADPSLDSFSIQPDRDNGLLELIHDARAVTGADFRLIASPWSAPAWMKDNGLLYDPKERCGGRLRREHHGTFARYFVKYVQAYAAEGIPIWAITPVNEPQGNAGNWESMDMSPEEQRDFVRVLGRTLAEAELGPHVLIFDQNRRQLPAYTAAIYGDQEASRHAFGAAVHWYDSTFKVYEDVLETQHRLYPDKVIIHTEGTIDGVADLRVYREACRAGSADAERLTPWWQNDPWYWQKEATDWGWDWAPEEDEPDHPRYAPAFRYARDLVVGMGHFLAGWVDWNIVLDKGGGPNHVENWCLAPVMVDGDTDTVYYAPTFHILSQVSRFSRPGGVVLETTVDGVPEGVVAASIRNPDGTIAVHVFSEAAYDVDYVVVAGDRRVAATSPSASLQTVVLDPRAAPA